MLWASSIDPFLGQLYCCQTSPYCESEWEGRGNEDGATRKTALKYKGSRDTCSCAIPEVDTDRGDHDDGQESDVVQYIT